MSHLHHFESSCVSGVEIDWPMNSPQGSILSLFKRECTAPPPKPPPPSYSPKPVLLDLDDVYDSFVASGSHPQKGVVIVDRDTRWIWDLFPIVLHWRTLGYPVNVVTEPPKPSKATDELARRALLKGLGCEIVEGTVRQSLFILSPDSSTDTIAFQFEHQKHYIARRRSRNSDSAILADIDAQLATYKLEYAPISPPPKIIAATEADITNKLTAGTGPVAYQQLGIDMAMEDVPLKDSYSISRSARMYRFRQTDFLISVFKKNGIPLFNPAAVELLNGHHSLITPPVVEETNGRFVFIEGNTRALHAICKGQTSIRCLVVRGVSTELPATPVPFDEVFMCRLKLPAAWRQIDWNYTAFRNIEEAIHNI